MEELGIGEVEEWRSGGMGSRGVGSGGVEEWRNGGGGVGEWRSGGPHWGSEEWVSG